jgi:hypothetical protein
MITTNCILSYNARDIRMARSIPKNGGPNLLATQCCRTDALQDLFH